MDLDLGTIGLRPHEGVRDDPAVDFAGDDAGWEGGLTRGSNLEHGKTINAVSTEKGLVFL
jgi:hypothetical protein